jgi:squalene-hopene/tetraprenyl-beta-curcumene cyclase
VDDLLRRGVLWIAEAQNADGGWSGFKNGPNSVEETALAVESLGVFVEVAGKDAAAKSACDAAAKGAAWLARQVNEGLWTQPSPVGFYFANLWYFEKLYPQIHTVAALSRMQSCGSEAGNLA